MTLAAFVCCFMLTSVFTSCTNSDNPAASNQGSAGIVVNPSTLYNELGIIDLMKIQKYVTTQSVQLYMPLFIIAAVLLVIVKLKKWIRKMIS